MNYGYIYKVTDLLNPHNLPNPFYVGQRKGKFNKNYYGSGKYIKDVVKKYGKNNFRVELIVVVSSAEEANKQEMYQIKENNCICPRGYNLSLGGEAFFTGKHHSDKTKSQMKETKAKNPFHHSKESKDAISKNNVGMLGKHQSKDSINKIRKAVKLYWEKVRSGEIVVTKTKKPRGPMSEEQKSLRREISIGVPLEKRGHKPNCPCCICEARDGKKLRDQERITSVKADHFVSKSI